MLIDMKLSRPFPVFLLVSVESRVVSSLIPDIGSADRLCPNIISYKIVKTC